MEKVICDQWEQKMLINELTQGRELTKQLKNHLNPSSSHETRQFLLEKIISSYEKAISMLNFVGDHTQLLTASAGILDYPPSPTVNSSGSQASAHYNHKDVHKKRETFSRWTEQVRVSSEAELEGHLEDGYSWRKYGQKDIHGATFPRGYYKCTHRNVQGCLATKQVQRSNEDPSIFEVTYRGRHTCIQASYSIPPSASQEKQVAKQNKVQYPHHHQQHKKEKQKQAQEKLISFGTGLQVRTDDMDSKEQRCQSFSFPSTSNAGSENEEHYSFSQPIMTEANCMAHPAYISPATSESNYFSPFHVNTTFGMCHNLQTSACHLTSAPTRVTNSAIRELDFSLAPVDFDSSFPFDSPDFFS